MQVNQEPNNARWARDWGRIHNQLGTAQIALGRFDEGLASLQESVHIAENVLTHDPLNAAYQFLVFGNLHNLAKGLAKIASAPETSPERRAELWQQATQTLTRCQAMLTSPAFAKLNMPDSKTTSDIAQEFDDARAALAKLAVRSPSEHPKP